ncbi:putative Mitogen-activated protein kinase kinase kinase [Rubrivivax sp. A210]|uniref:serine/threonine protein kinase n=1 Tax=Rubrivivax sp. A210 TaxID=2772301 RepID=UPI0019196E5D|nr:serine/threonine-protein kinase [Rubrivivax sp. A210]CAD5374332.1 putative Mitogen-activated protein kinase kinase kinase [Rubrivivax sp. A210]
MSDDDDGARERAEQRTVLMPRRDRGSELAPGHKLQEFVIERVLGVGGYSIVYLARDTRLDRRVALKEYLPATLAMRAPDGEVVPRLPRFEAFYAKGLQSFINEGRLLGAFEHPSLVKVYRFWAENGTAYMVMPYYEGITLKKWLTDLGAPPSEAWLRELAYPMMEALAVMHGERCYHRDVAPDNILMLYDRHAGSYLEQMPRPVLLDFGAARRVIGDATQNLTSILKSGYSPVEQYESDESLRQGPWTDVYALCAVLYAAAVGRMPKAAIARAVKDEQVPAREAARGRYGEPFLAAIDAGLAVRPEARPQSMAELRRLFDAKVAPAAVSAAPAAPVPQAAPRPAWLLPALGAAALAVAAVAFLLLRR